MSEKSFQPSPSSPSPDLTVIAAMLSEAAQALLDFCQAPKMEDAPQEKSVQEDEVRCYRFSPLAIRGEQELFEDQGAASFRELLFNACSSLTTFTTLLEIVEAEAEVEGTILHLLARELKRVEDLLFKIQDTYSTVDLIEA